MQYSEKFKEKMIAKMTGPEVWSANSLSKECGVSQAALSKWLRHAKMPFMGRTGRGGGKRWTPQEKIRVVTEAESADGVSLGALLRREGLH